MGAKMPQKATSVKRSLLRLPKDKSSTPLGVLRPKDPVYTKGYFKTAQQQRGLYAPSQLCAYSVLDDDFLKVKSSHPTYLLS